MPKGVSTVISRIQAIIIIAILLSSITILISTKNFIFFEPQRNSMESEFLNGDQLLEPSNTDPETTTNKPTVPQEPIKPIESDQPIEQQQNDKPTLEPPNSEPNAITNEPTEPGESKQPDETEPKENQIPESSNTEPTRLEQASVRVGNVDFNFNPIQVERTRPDLFNPGYFSMFDVLLHLNKLDLIDLEYHFEESLNSHIIDLINGESNWWYQTYYSGGWTENNVFRPDHYPWKEGTTLSFFKTSPQNLNGIYSVWEEEVKRKITNNGKIIIPEVIIMGESRSERALIFENVEVTPHSLRKDIFKEDVITAIDVILSLGDQEKITYELQWYESIGTANIVKNYWVDAINEDKAYGRSGFVYEAGSIRYQFSSGNHIHLPSDVRILNSPEYVKYFWINI